MKPMSLDPATDPPGNPNGAKKDALAKLTAEWFTNDSNPAAWQSTVIIQSSLQ
jgi:hypothetical protein